MANFNQACTPVAPSALRSTKATKKHKSLLCDLFRVPATHGRRTNAERNKIMQTAIQPTLGKVILGNFHPRNPDKALMDHVFDWRLIHRTEADMDRLFRASAFQRACTNVRFEEQGI